MHIWPICLSGVVDHTVYSMTNHETPELYRNWQKPRSQHKKGTVN